MKKANRQPRLKPALTTGDRTIEAAAILMLLAMWGIVLFSFSKLPDVVPTHFDATGKPDAFGDKTSLLLLPVLSTILFAGMTIINNYPHIFNYPVKITPENALRQYTIATRLVRTLKGVIMILFFIILYFTIRTALQESGGLGFWFLPLFLIMVYVPVLYYFVLSFRKK
jgi:uncharacterized membrane protein